MAHNSSEDKSITYHILCDDIDGNDMDKFKEHFTNGLRNTTKEENLKLLLKSIESGAKTAFDLLMASGIDYNEQLEDSSTPIHYACIVGNYYCLKVLLNKPDTTLFQTDVLFYLISVLNKKPQQPFCDFWKCFKLILNSDKVSIDKIDEDGDTALHAAVICRNNKAIKMLLNKGANLSIENNKGELAMDGMSPKVLEEHLNNCISVNSADFNDTNFKIFINFRNFIPEKNVLFFPKLTNVMAPMSFMAKSKKHQHLLQHPVVTSFLFLKWHKISLTFYIGFLLYLFYALSIITHIVLKFRESQYHSAVLISAKLSFVGTVYLIIRESLQFIVHPKRYLRSVTNYVEIVLIILSLLTCTSFQPFAKETQRVIAVFTILLAALDLCFLVGYLPIPSISTHILMLEAVCKSFWKSFLLYSILIISFALSFYVMHDKPADKDKSFDNFWNPLVAFTKTIVMLTGEFDAGNLEFKTFYSYLIFLLFVCFMTIILFNLLNGLAVSDTQTIQEQGELNYIICRTYLLARYQQLVLERSKHRRALVNHKPFSTMMEYFQDVLPDYGTRIAILPNDNNKIVVPTLKSKSEYSRESNYDNDSHNSTIVSCFDSEDSDMETEQERLSGCLPCSTRMDEQTVKLATSILEKRFLESFVKRPETIEDKLKKMEKNLTKVIEEKLKKLEKKLLPNNKKSSNKSLTKSKQSKK